MVIVPYCHPGSPALSLCPGKKKDPLTASFHLMTINDNKYSFLIHFYYNCQNFINMFDVNQNVCLSLEQIKNNNNYNFLNFLVGEILCLRFPPSIHCQSIKNSSAHIQMIESKSFKLQYLRNGR